MVVGDYYSSGTDAIIDIDIGTMDTTVIIFDNEAYKYDDEILDIRKKDPFWAKQGKSKKGGKTRYVR